MGNCFYFSTNDAFATKSSTRGTIMYSELKFWGRVLVVSGDYLVNELLKMEI